MPALKSAKESARKITCMNNLRQIGVAINVYMGENSGQVPLFANANGFEIVPNNQGWSLLLIGNYLKEGSVYETDSPGDAFRRTNTPIRDYIVNNPTLFWMPGYYDLTLLFNGAWAPYDGIVPSTWKVTDSTLDFSKRPLACDMAFTAVVGTCPQTGQPPWSPHASSHDGRFAGMNVLYGGGNVQWLSAVTGGFGYWNRPAVGDRVYPPYGK